MTGGTPILGNHHIMNINNFKSSNVVSLHKPTNFSTGLPVVHDMAMFLDITPTICHVVQQLQTPHAKNCLHQAAGLHHGCSWCCCAGPDWCLGCSLTTLHRCKARSHWSHFRGGRRGCCPDTWCWCTWSSVSSSDRHKCWCGWVLLTNRGQEDTPGAHWHPLLRRNCSCLWGSSRYGWP